MSHWHSNEQISPWHNHASNTANYSSATGVDHPALCEELRNKVQFSIPQAFIVQGCCSGVRAPRGQCTADINIGKLKTIVARAGTSEKDVYEPLVSTSSTISVFQSLVLITRFWPTEWIISICQSQCH